MKSIVNVNKSWGIGKGGDLLVNIPEDMKFFRGTTAGGVVIMGRKTLESFPDAKPLKGRMNVVLTRDASRIPDASIKASDEYVPELSSDESAARFIRLSKQITSHKNAPASERATVLAVCDNADRIAALCSVLDTDSVYVIGGSSIYEQMLKYCDTCIVTINDSSNEADSFYPNLDKLPEWEHSLIGETKEYNGIHYHFDTYTRKTDHIHFEEIDSTNNYAKRLIDECRQSGRALPDCTVISADRQLAGRGRSGKSFESPSGESIYMTLVLKVNETADKCMLLTPAAAVGTLTALEEAGSERLGIKWVNDLFLEDRKVCGILTEAVFAVDGSRIEFAIIGIGININLDIKSLPDELYDIVGTISRLSLKKPDMIMSIAEHVRTKALNALSGKSSFMRIYRERSILIGREIYWEDACGKHSGTVRDINDSGNLLVDEEGKLTVLMSGEVSVKKTMTAYC